MRRTTAAVLAIGVWCAPLILAAQEVRLNAPQADEDLQTSLNAASLTLGLQRDGANAAQDYVAAARADYRRLLTGLYGAGYYSGTISILVDGVEASGIDPLIPRASVQVIELNVTTGPRFTFGRDDIAPLAAGTDIPDTFRRGEVARADVVSDAAQAAVTAWRGAGYPLARPGGQTITARHGDRELDVLVNIEPGPQLTFGRIAVSGNETVRTERVLAIAGIPEGTFDPELTARAEANLRRTGAFSSASVIESDTAQGTTLPLTLSVVEQAPRRVGAGIEFSSVSGLTLSSYWLHRNLLGGAERLRIDGDITGLSGGTAGIDYTLGATFLRPATFRQDIDFFVSTDIAQLDEPLFFQRDGSVEAGVIRRLLSGAELEFGIGVASGKISDVLGDRSYTLLYLPLKATKDARDDPFDATSGYFANLALTPFVGAGNTASGLRVLGDGRMYRSFGADDRVTLAFRGQIGSILGGDATRVPASYLFFSGGGGTVRGQPFQSLAVDLGGGNEIGGTSFFGAQIEARVGLTDTIGMVGFYDTGFIGADDIPFGNGDWHSGAGIGLRYDTGIGPIRLDLGIPASGDDAGKRLEVYIGIGQAF